MGGGVSIYKVKRPIIIAEYRSAFYTNTSTTISQILPFASLTPSMSKTTDPSKIHARGIRESKHYHQRSFVLNSHHEIFISTARAKPQEVDVSFRLKRQRLLVP